MIPGIDMSFLRTYLLPIVLSLGTSIQSKMAGPQKSLLDAPPRAFMKRA